jgi:septal ring factor EnvC (AmiA/AmiB activator)
MKIMHDDKVKRLLVAGGVLVLVCIVCLFVSISTVDKYRKKVAETTLLEQKLEDLEQDIKRQDIKTMELESMRYGLSLEKGQISKDYSTIKEKYLSLGKTISVLENDVIGLQKTIKFVENSVPDPVIGDVDSSIEETQLIALRNQNEELVKRLAAKTKEKMIMKIALESQANRLGLSENYDPELKTILKNLVTTLQ